MAKSIRISKKLNEMFPAPVVRQIKAIAADHHIKSFNLETTSKDRHFYVSEGERYIGIATDGKTASFEVVSENNIGGAGMSHKIGEVFAMPAGTYLINVYYYTKYFMTVYQISPKMIEANL